MAKTILGEMEGKGREARPTLGHTSSTMSITRKKRFPMNRLPLCLTFFAFLFLSLLIVPCLKASQAVSHLSSTLFGAIIAFSNVLRMKLLGKAVSFDSLSYSLISFHMLTYFHMLLGFFFDFICVANALGC